MRPTITDSELSLTPEMLARTEKQLGFRLPKDYAAFLRQHNGGRPKPNVVSTPSFPGSASTDVHWFYAIDARLRCYDLAVSYERWTRDSPANLLPIACDSGGSEFCLGVRGDDDGAVYYWDWHRERHPVQTRYPWIYPVADSLDEFLGGFRELLIEETGPARANQFVWCTDWITAEVCRDDECLGIGQYLHLRQRLPTGTTGWRMKKLKIPESWSIQELKVADDAVTIRTADGRVFQLTRHNVGGLGSAILGVGKEPDSELEKVWREHAQVHPPIRKP